MRLLGSIPRACSFCGASKRDVAKLIAGPLFYICEGCVTAAIQTIETRGAEASRILLICDDGGGCLRALR